MLNHSSLRDLDLLLTVKTSENKYLDAKLACVYTASRWLSILIILSSI